MKVTDRLQKFDFDVNDPHKFSDGYNVNFICFWSSAIPQSKIYDKELSYHLKNAKNYSSQLTQINLLTKTSSKLNKMTNWQVLNEKVLSKLDLQIDQETMNHLIQGNKHIFLKFMDILFNALDKFIQMGPSEQKMQITELHNLKIQQILSQYTITDRAKEMENLNQLTKSEQNEYALQLSQPIQKSQFKFVKGQCQSCQMYQQKIKLLEGEIELLKKQLDKK